MTAITRQLDRAAGPLCDEVTAAMYTSPFWADRFPRRGRKYAVQDAHYHVAYLIEALTADDPEVFVRYALWLRELLLARGMCSRHLAENFARLAEAIERRPWPDRDRAVAVLTRGVVALRWGEGEAGGIEARRGDWVLALQRPLAHWTDDVDLHLSYLADAVAAKSPDRFASHLTFCRRARLAVGLSGERLEDLRVRLGQLAAEAALPATVAALSQARTETQTG